MSRHVCGIEGYSQEIDGPCPGCVQHCKWCHERCGFDPYNTLIGLGSDEQTRHEVYRQRTYSERDTPSTGGRE